MNTNCIQCDCPIDEDPAVGHYVTDADPPYWACWTCIKAVDESSDDFDDVIPEEGMMEEEED